MKDTMTSPEAHSGKWRLAARVPDSVRRLLVHPDGMDLVLLIADGEGDWWAVPAACRACGTLMEPRSADVTEPAEVVTCGACGAEHGPHREEGETVPTLIADDEIYVLKET